MPGWAIGAGNRLSGETANMTARYSDAELVATWSRWKTQLIARSRAEGQAAILIEKADHRLTLYRNGELVESFPVDLGPNSIPAKSHAGDSATPEGQYRIVAKKGRSATASHRALLLAPRTNATVSSFFGIARTDFCRRLLIPGGLIGIHGAGGRGRGLDQWLHRDDQRRHQSVVQLVDVGSPVAPCAPRGRLATTLRAHCSGKDSGRPAEPGRPDAQPVRQVEAFGMTDTSQSQVAKRRGADGEAAGSGARKGEARPGPQRAGSRRGRGRRDCS